MEAQSRVLSLGDFDPDIHTAAHPFVQSLGEACGECGFASVIDHGISRNLLSGRMRSRRHTDLGGATAIPAAMLGGKPSDEPRWTGLIAEDRHGNEVKIREVPDSITWNLADWTVELARHLGATASLTSAWHKVVITPELSLYDRIVVVLFLQMRWDVQVGIRPDGTPITAGDRTAERLRDIKNGVLAPVEERIEIVREMQERADATPPRI